MQRKCLAEEEQLRTRPQGRIESLPHPNSPGTLPWPTSPAFRRGPLTEPHYRSADMMGATPAFPDRRARRAGRNQSGHSRARPCPAARPPSAATARSRSRGGILSFLSWLTAALPDFILDPLDMRVTGKYLRGVTGKFHRKFGCRLFVTRLGWPEGRRHHGKSSERF